MKRLICLSLCILLILEGASLKLCSQQVLTAQVTAVSGNRLTIDQGALRGLKPGNEGVVYYMQSVAERTVRLEVALARVVSVNDDSAQLVVTESAAPVEQGYLVDLQVSAPAPVAPTQATAGKKKSKWWIWLIVAAAGGGIAAAAAGGGGGDSGSSTPTPTTGSFTIHLPAN
ncbi:MAG TPA: hypothetical protein VM123_09305 [archaeon]|nr:hypothetical protein [archaeon]